MKINTIRELERYLREDWPDDLKDQPLNITFFDRDAVTDYHCQPVYLYGDDGELYLQNREWDDGAS